MKMKKIKKLVFFLLFPALILFLTLQGVGIYLLPVVFIYLSLFVVAERENLYKMLAAHQFKKRNLPKALRLIYKAYLLKDSSVHTAVTFVYFLLKSGKFVKAGEIISELEKRAMNEQELNIVALNKALFLWKSSRVEEAAQLYEKLLGQYESTSLYSSYGYLILLTGDLDKALELNLKAYQFNPESSAIMDNLGLTYLKRNQPGESLALYEKLMEREPRFPEAYYNMALLMEEMMDHDSAVHYLGKALEQDFDGLSTVTREEVERKLNQLNKLYGKPS